MKLLSFLAKPHPFIFNVGSVVLPGIITFLIIALLAPLGLQSLEIIPRVGFALLIGAIASFSILAVVSGLKFISPSHEENWTLGKEILLIVSVVLIIILIIYMVYLMLDLSSLDPISLFKKVFLKTLLISIFPIIILVLFEQHNHQKSQWEKARELNSHLGEGSSRTSKLIQLTGENGKIELQLSPDELIFLKADGNYVEVMYGLDQPEKKLVRNRLKSLAEQLSRTQFFQCHKSYVVNKHSIISVDGNARNFELKLRGFPDSIPVSRAKSGELTKFLSQQPAH